MNFKVFPSITKENGTLNVKNNTKGILQEINNTSAQYARFPHRYHPGGVLSDIS